MKIPTKEEIATVARKLWPEGERREGRVAIKPETPRHDHADEDPALGMNQPDIHGHGGSDGTQTLVCPTCKSDRWAEIHASKTDPTGFTLYCRRCEEGCVSPLKI